MRRTPSSTLFPYTTLFRSHGHARHALDVDPVAVAVGEAPGDVAVGARHQKRRAGQGHPVQIARRTDRKSTRLNSSHSSISYAVFCLKKKTRLASNHLPSLS